ncbi:MAG: uncharacterized protein KVP18_003280 [Porospora cf. gigantea A]|nr:MAG: hypothetical protein KVP18_003280 [Porospora cf. gigantea A]
MQPVPCVRHLAAILLNVTKPSSMPEMQSVCCAPFRSVNRLGSLEGAGPFVASPMPKLEVREPPVWRNLICLCDVSFYAAVLLWLAVVLFCCPAVNFRFLYCRELMIFMMAWLQSCYGQKLFLVAKRLNCAVAYSAAVGLFMGQVAEIGFRQIYAICQGSILYGT